MVCVLRLHNAGWHKWSLQFLDYLGEYKILPLFLPSQKSPKLTNVIMDGKQQQGNATIKQQTKQKQKHLHLWVDLMAIAPTLPIVTWAG